MNAFILRFAGFGGFFIFKFRSGLSNGRDRKVVVINPFALFCADKIERSVKMKIVAGCSVLLATALVAQAQDNFADTVVSYVAGSTHDSSFDNSSVALGAPTTGSDGSTPYSIIYPAYKNTQIAVINDGGELTLGFNTPIVNDPVDHAYGMDFTIFGNDFFAGTASKLTGFSGHPGLTVWVSQDDVNFYELDVPNGYGADDSYPEQGSGNHLLPVNPTLSLSSFTGLTEAQALSDYNGSAGGASFSISWAVDANGNLVDLSSINEIEIEGQNLPAGFSPTASNAYGLVDAIARVEDVPEPATLGLFGAGVMLFGFGRWRKGMSKMKSLKITRLFLTLVLGMLAVSSARAYTISENFTNNPFQNGWQIYGDTNLFTWDSTDGVLDVTWDSSQTNSYFYVPLCRTLTRTNDFTIAFDLELNQAEANNNSFELAIGLFNLSEATSPGFQRSTGYNSPDLVEFDYFPNTSYDYGSTVWPIFVDTNSTFNWNGESDYAIYTPNPGDWYHVVMTYSAASQTMVTTMTNFEQTSGITIVDPIEPYVATNAVNFTDFQVDTLSISSYQDDGLGDSIYAQGKVADISVTMPAATATVAGPIVEVENFTNDPSQNGWQEFGDTNLFTWDSTNGVMDVTWDSTQTNSYFYHALGTTLTRRDNFTLAFDLELNQAEAYGYGFQLAVGLFNYSVATNADFQRSTGYSSPDLVEFDYFPDVGFGPTVWPLFVDTNSAFNYNGTNDYAIYAPNLDDWYHVVMTYSAASQTMVTTMTNFEQTSGITVVDPIMPYVATNAANFTDFRVDTLSISSYQDDGLGDTIYAQGAVGNFVLMLPPVTRNLACAFSNGVAQVESGTYVNWNYMLQRSTDFVTWSNVTGCVSGTGNTLTLCDTNAPVCKAFYRVVAAQP